MEDLVRQSQKFKDLHREALKYINLNPLQRGGILSDAARKLVNEWADGYSVSDYCGGCLDKIKKPSAGEVLNYITQIPEVSCVVVGTASIEEAEENSKAEYSTYNNSKESRFQLKKIIKNMQTKICNRCGECDKYCSKGLQISWIFRSAYINLHPGVDYENWDNVEYFQLHPNNKSICASCNNITCRCKFGINIQEKLIELHKK